MTKEEERLRFAAILEAQPKDSYLRSIFSGIQGMVNTAIADDFGFIDFDMWMDLQRERKEITQHIVTAGQMLKDLDREIREKAALRDRILDQLNTLRSEAMSLANRAMAQTIGR